jgi:hypothetical protein
MLPVAEQRASKDELYIKLGDGREYLITRAQVQTLYGQQQGNAASRKAATILAIKNQIAAAFGVETVDVNLLLLDFDTADTSKDMLFETRAV